jgi:hypothetical protein
MLEADFSERRKRQRRKNFWQSWAWGAETARGQRSRFQITDNVGSMSHRVQNTRPQTAKLTLLLNQNQHIAAKSCATIVSISATRLPRQKEKPLRRYRARRALPNRTKTIYRPPPPEW